jgi:hypothetical protein
VAKERFPELRTARFLLRRIVPTDAEAVVRDTDERGGQLLTGSEAMILANITQEQVDQDALWVFYTPDVPPQFKRLWTARRINA